jgi:hypothetical protein
VTNPQDRPRGRPDQPSPAARPTSHRHQVELADLASLAHALTQHRITAQLITPHPYLTIVHPHTDTTHHIYTTGSHFYLAPAHPVAPRNHPILAADILTWALRAHPTPTT